jgi:cell division protein FtsB
MNARLDRGVLAAPGRPPTRNPHSRPRPETPDPPRKAPAAPLRVVRPKEQQLARRSRRRARLAAVATVLTIGVGLFGVVALHVILTQNQFRLDRLRRDAATEQSRYERLRLNVAELESPQRIVATAQDRLGMVVPPDVRYLTPPAAPASAETGSNQSSAGKATRTNNASGTAAGSPGAWSTVKPQLAARP